MKFNLIELLLTMLSIYSLAMHLAGDAGWQELALLVDRFTVAPVHLVSYIFLPDGIPTAVMVSIEGRYIGESSDSAWLVLYQDAGWIGLGAVILASSLLVMRGIQMYLIQPCPESVYTLLLPIFCLLTGFVMRVQIFPVWLFIGLAIIFCAGYPRPLGIAPDKAGR